MAVWSVYVKAWWKVTPVLLFLNPPKYGLGLYYFSTATVTILTFKSQPQSTYLVVRESNLYLELRRHNELVGLNRVVIVRLLLLLLIAAILHVLVVEVLPTVTYSGLTAISS